MEIMLDLVYFKTFQVYSSLIFNFNSIIFKINFKTFQVYSSYINFSVTVSIIRISKLFKFIVHDTAQKLQGIVSQFQNFSSL